MRKIIVFLASSNELLDDRKELEIKINRKNKQISDLGYFIHLENWEDLSTKMSTTRSQDEYNKKIKTSHIFILLGYSKIGRYTEEEFDFALECFNKTESPQIHTFFKKIEEKTSESLNLFKEKLSGLSHFYASYSNIDSLWNQLNNEILRYIKNIDGNHSDKQVGNNTVLFNSYTIDCEPYYFERSTDKTFNNSLKIENVWVFGKSGSGKTTLINRNLKLNEVEYCYCDLSPANILTADDVLNDILCTIEDKFGVNRDEKETNITKQIVNILCKLTSKQVIIVIDELAIDDSTLLQEIADILTRLVIYYSSKNTNDLKFVVSTISNPKILVKNISKTGNYFQFICCDEWKDESQSLFEIIINALKLNLEDSKDLILRKSCYSPRLLKSIIKKIIISNNFEKKEIEKTIDKVISEIV